MKMELLLFTGMSSRVGVHANYTISTNLHTMCTKAKREEESQAIIVLMFWAIHALQGGSIRRRMR